MRLCVLTVAVLGLPLAAHAAPAITGKDCAEEDRKRAIDLQPSNALAFYCRSLAEGSVRHYDEAIADLRKALEMEPQRLFDWPLFQEPELVQVLDRLIAENPSDGFLYRCRGNARVERREALADYDKAIDLAPHVWNNYNARGQSYLAIEENDKAVADFTKALELNPSLGPSFLWQALRRRGTIADLSQLLELWPNDISVLRERGRLYVLKHDWQKAIDDFSALISFEPRAEYYLQRAYAYQQKGDEVASKADYQTASSLRKRR